MLDAFAARGVTNILTWQPYDWHASGSQPRFAISNILAGNFDAYIRSWATAAKAYGKPIYIRLAHEMNGDWYPWGQGINGNTRAQFVSMWRYVVDKFRAAGATNVRWVWSPNVVGNAGQYPLTGLYPGDAYVDMIGLDGYNWGTSGIGEAGWRSFTQIFGTTYDQVRALAPSKPVYVAEMASTELGGDKAAWITSAFQTEIPNRFPALVGVLWFDTGGLMHGLAPAQNADWGINSSPSALAAFRAVVTSPTWSGRLP
jgi:beta-mannanase